MVIKQLAEALRFLTILPIPGKPALSEQALVRSMVAFPLAGTLIGGLVAATWFGATWLWGATTGGLCAILTWGAITSGLHLDGIADSADALFSWRSRERKLEIMKDSRIGTMGAIALISILLLKWLFVLGCGELAWRALIVAPTLGRWVDIIGIFWFPPAAEGGLGRTFHDHTRRSDFWWATICSGLVALGLFWWWAGLIFAVVIVSTMIIAHWMVRSLGGLTGDTYGALCEIAEMLVLAVVAALVKHQVL